MKIFSAALDAHYASRDTTLAHALKITRGLDSQVYGFTSNDVDDTVSGVLYRANPGLDVTNIVIAANAAVGNLELKTLHDEEVFTTREILGGLWRNAVFQIFRYNYKALTAGIDTLLAGTLGEAEIRDTELVVELRDWRQYLQQSVGEASSKTCRARLGDARCRKDLTDFTFAFTVTHVTSNQVFRDSSITEDEDWFAEGTFTFTDGANAGIPFKVKTSTTNGTLTLALPAFGNVTVGDHGVLVAGCRKRFEDDCIDKFDNALNFQGEPHRRGLNNVVQRPEANV